MPNFRDEHYTPAEAAAQVNWTEDWLRKRRWLRQGPPFVRVGKRVFYPKAAFREWILSHSQSCDPAAPTKAA